MAGVPLSSASVVQPQQAPASLVHASTSVGSSKFFSEEGRVREVLQQLQGRLVNAQQLKLAISQQPPSTGISAASSTQQIAQAEGIAKRLMETATKLQEAVQDFTLAGVQERFRSMAASLGLKFDVQHSKQSEVCSLFLACEGFYVEICCQESGRINWLKLAQANKQVDSELLNKLACEGKFQQLEKHLRSLVNFYKQGAGPSCEAANMYHVITSLESMLFSITQMSPQTILSEVILSNPLGHVMPRSGGLPMKLVFFVHPSDMLKSPSRYNSLPSDRDYIQHVDGPDLGVSASLSLQASEKVYPLSVDPNLFDVSKATFFPMTPQKIVNISASYILHLSKELPVSGAIREELHEVMYSQDKYQPMAGPHINQLIAREAASSKGETVSTSKTRTVCLPHQRHHYYVPPELLSCDGSPDQSFPSSECGAMMSKITFLHPVHIFNIVTLLRKQLVYNALVSSVVGRSHKKLPPVAESESEFIFKLSTQPALHKVTVNVDMQDNDKQLAVDFVITDRNPSEPLVMVRVGLNGSPVESQNLSEIVKKCMSIPVTLYAVVKCPQLLDENAAFVLQNYLQSVCDFDRELSSEREGEDSLSLGGKKRMEEDGLMDLVGEMSYGVAAGVKRKRTD